ncbi:MAG: RNase adaptor protein RapZ [Bacillales bacterium]|nr:RNase adaptor protein RapZ [Bacillales bacterium]
MSNDNQSMQMVIITGMSGAGKTVAIQCFEDLGYFCVDNLPPTLLSKFVDIIKESRDKMDKIALVMDLRGRDFFNNVVDALNELETKHWVNPQLLFLDANDATIVRRYKESRRSHPLASEGLPLEGIKKERALLEEIKGRSQTIIDSSDLKPKDLREKIYEKFEVSSEDTFSINVVSFGFKYGILIDADLVYDVRFLPNPYYIETMRPKTGLDNEVSSYVLKWTESKMFLEKLTDLLDYIVPYYKREGKRQLVIGIGCTGGQHRSVTIVEYLKEHFKSDYKTLVFHRDIEKRKDKNDDKPKKS